jgi:hypothetical protein
MRNGLYSIHIEMLDGVKGRATGIIILRDGRLFGGDSYFYYTGHYLLSGPGKWKGELVTHQHTPSHASPVFGGRDVSCGFSGKHDDVGAEVYGTALVAARSISFRATLRWLVEA